MHKNHLLDQLRKLRDYADADRQVAVSRAKELILQYALDRDVDIKHALRRIEGTLKD